MTSTLTRMVLAVAVLVVVASCTPSPGGTSGPDPYLTGRQVLAWGANDAGQLGDGSTQQRLAPVAAQGLDNIRAIAAGGSRSLALLTDGTVWEWGAGRSTPTKVSGLADITAIAVGERHALALTKGHQVYAWGENESGQLGDNSTTPHASPVVVNNLSNAVSVAAGRAHSIAIRSDLTVMAWGANDKGQLGDGTNTSRLEPVVVPNLNAIEVATSNNHTLAVSSDVKVMGWGDNHLCQLGENPPRPPGKEHLFDPARCDNSNKPLSLGGDVSSTGHAIAASATATLIRTPQNRVDVLGALVESNPIENCSDTIFYFRGNLVGAPPDVVAVTSGPRHSLLLTADGRVFGSGANNAGQLGTGTPTAKSCMETTAGLRAATVVAAGASYSLAVVEGVLSASPPAPIAFPSTPVGSTAMQTVTLTNSGLAPLAIHNLATGGDFRANNNCPARPATLVPNATCTLDITFEPTSAGARAGAVTIGHDGRGRALTLDLMGAGTEPKVTFAPTLLDFGPQRVGTTSQPARTVTIRNDGDADMVVNAVQASAGFDVAATTCPSPPQVVPKNGGSCTANVTFSPLEAKPAVGDLTVSYSGGKTASMTLRGTGIASRGTITPASITFMPTAVGSATQPVTITVTNTATLPLTLGTTVITGDFQAATNTCDGVTLSNAGDTCTIGVRFMPTTTGTTTGKLTIPTNGIPAALTADLEGTGA